jgi:hypothetical protein
MTILKYTLIFIVAGAICGFIGYGLGIDEGYRQHEQTQKIMGMDQLRKLLKENEEQHILELVRASAEINKKDEGGLFSTKYIHYINCKILNAASVATVKDVKVRIDFFSKTDALINSDEISIYEFIRPNREYTLKQKIKWPGEADKFSVNVVSAGYDNR